jgi:hypothetical protein
LEHIDGSFVAFPDHDIGILRQNLDVGLMNDECGNCHSERTPANLYAMTTVCNLTVGVAMALVVIAQNGRLSIAYD